MRLLMVTLMVACASSMTTPAFAKAKASAVSKIVTVTPEQALERAIDAALKDNNKLAEALLKQVLVVSKSGDLKDHAHLELARVLYQEGKFELAAEEYRQVSKASPQWLMSLEERGWAELRAGKPAQSLAATKTVLNAQFASKAGSEPFFLQAITQLKICDYPGVLKTIGDFKKRMTPVASSLQSRADAGDAKARTEAATMSQMIAKLQLVEVEATQHMYALNKDGQRKQISKIQTNRNTLEFPDSDEVWQDELEDSYQVQAKGCPTLGGLSK